MSKDHSPDWNLEPVAHWLMRDGRLLPDIDETVRQMGPRLEAAGAPVWRIRLSMRTLHPLITAISALWERDSGPIGGIESPHGFEGNAAVVGSPLDQISRTGAPLRKNLIDLGDGDHAVYHELAARGATDYFGLPLRFAGQGGGILVVVTDRPGGFQDRDIDRFTALAELMTPIVEVFRLRKLTAAVAETYLGPRAGQRVLGGQITRGDIEEIDAAILVSDMRDWTGLNSRLPAEQAVALANRYFELLETAVSSQGGEILKFIGDGVLAVFESEAGAGQACARALAAAQSAQDHARQAAPPPGFEFGIGLHFGRVMYGNVGAANRLDFTVLGQAVNLAARVEGLTARLKARVLYSDEFAGHLPAPGRRIARERLKGLDEEIGIWRP